MISLSLVIPIIFVTAILANITIAAFVFANNQKSATNKVFFALGLFVSIWLVAMYATQLAILRPFFLSFARSTLVLATPMNILFYVFAKTVPDDEIGISKRSRIILIVITAVMTAIFLSHLGFSRIDFVNDVPVTIQGPAMPLFGLFSVGMNILAVVTLFLKTRRATGARSDQMRLILMGTLLMFGMIIGTVLVPVLLFGDSTFVAFSPVYVLIFTGFAEYAIFKKHLISVDVVAAELFSVALLVTNSVQLFLASSAGDFALRLATFVAVAIISMLFIRSIRDEVKRREELQILSKKLSDANEQLKAIDDTKSEFISIASHQLRTPISVIKGYLSLMLDGAYGKQGPEAAEKIEHMYEMNERLVQMVNNMLNVSRMEKSRLEYLCAPTDVSAIASESVEEMGLKAKQANVSVTFSASEGVLMAFVDKEKLQEVFSNLLDNAIKYSPKGGVVSVRVAPYRRGEEVLVSVSDQGIGMTDAEAKSVFKKFVRIKSDKTINISGSGLGLYVCLMFVEGMGGKIWIEKTAPNKGTTFTFVLPTQPKQQCARPPKKAATKAA